MTLGDECKQTNLAKLARSEIRYDKIRHASNLWYFWIPARWNILDDIYNHEG